MAETVTVEALAQRIQELRQQLAEAERVKGELNAELRAVREQVVSLLDERLQAGAEPVIQGVNRR